MAAGVIPPNGSSAPRSRAAGKQILRKEKVAALGERTAEIARALQLKTDYSSTTASLAPLGFPIGPYDVTRDELHRTVNSFTQDPATGKGGFKLSVQRTVYADPLTKATPIKVDFRCNKQGCTFEVGYERCVEGWIHYRYHPHVGKEEVFEGNGTKSTRPIRPENEHGHELTHSKAEARAQHGAQAGNIPSELDYIATIMSESGCKPKEVSQVLDHHGRELGLDVTAWDYDHIYNKYFRTAGAADALDLEGLAAYLEVRKREKGLNFEMTLDRHGYVVAVFYELAGGRKTWAHCKTTNVLLFDQTFGTSRHGMKLCWFVSVDTSGGGVEVREATREKRSASDGEDEEEVKRRARRRRGEDGAPL